MISLVAPERRLFVHDRLANVTAAGGLGMTGGHFTGVTDPAAALA